MARLPFKIPQLPFTVGPRMRVVLRYVGFALFAILAFLFALQATFPYERAINRGIENVSGTYDISYKSIERGVVPGRVYLNKLSIATRPTKPDEVINRLFIDRLEVDVGLLSLIGGKISVMIEAHVDTKLGGVLEATVDVGKFGKGDISVAAVGRSLPGGSLPMRMLLGLPMTGKINLDVDLHLVRERSKTGRTSIAWTKSAGDLTFACPSGCTFGDGKTKLKPLLKNTRNQVMVGEGIDFGKVNLDTLLAKAEMKAGKLELKKWEVKSQDGNLKVDFLATLAADVSESNVAGCLRFKGSDGLLKREPKTYAAIQTTGAELRADGYFHIKLTERFKDMKRLNLQCGPGTDVGNGEDFSKAHNERPNLTVTPDEPAKPALNPPPPIAVPETPPQDAAAATPPPTMPPNEHATGRTPGPENEGPPRGSADGTGGPPTPPGGAAPTEQPHKE